MSKDLTKRKDFLGAFNNFYNRSFGDLLNEALGNPIEPLVPEDGFSNMELVDNDTSIDISLELPGVGIGDIDVSIDGNNNLTIKGEKKSENTEKEKGRVIKTERYYGSFSRVIQLGDNIDPNKIDATYKNGVLKLTIPKTGAAKGTIKVEVKQ